MNQKEIIFLRGEVINSFIGIELMVNTIISMHYLGRVDTNFTIDILNNEMSSFGFKKTMLKQILGEKKHASDFQKLEKLNRIRNLFGHATLILMSDKGIKSITDEKAKILFRNPKKPNEEIDPETKFKEYEKLFLEVDNWLRTIGRDKGINYPQPN